MFRSIFGFAIFAVLAWLGLKIVFGILGGLIGLAMTILLLPPLRVPRRGGGGDRAPVAHPRKPRRGEAAAGVRHDGRARGVQRVGGAIGRSVERERLARDRLHLVR